MRTDLSSCPSPHSWKNKLGRCAWQIVYALLFRFSPRPCWRWRAWLLRLFGARGRGFGIHRRARVWAPWNLAVGEDSMIDDEVDVYNAAPVSIGDRTIISRKTFLCAASHDHTRANMPLTTAPIEIGDDVWVAADVFVAPGVSIGTGTVVGARATVVGDLPEWKVCVGNPCRPIKDRVIVSAPADAGDASSE